LLNCQILEFTNRFQKTEFRQQLDHH
jgi:hypothetical protein